MATFSGASTPRFENNFDMGFGTPQDLFNLNDKGDYFSSSNKMQSDYGFPGLFSTSPYPTRMDITPPQTATDPPTNWPYDMEISEQPIDDTFGQQHTQQTRSDAKKSTVKMQYGQTTPPDEAQRAPDMDELKNGFPAQSQQQSKNNSTTSSSIIKKEPSTVQSKSLAKPTKRSKKNKNLDSNEELDKRNKFLERNRVAASKCRQKKKEHNGQLEHKAKILERDNAFLKMELEKHQTEKINLMTTMALHTPNVCDCHEIHQHLARFKAQFSDPSPTTARRQSILSNISSLSEAAE